MTRRRRIMYSTCSWAPTSLPVNHSSNRTRKRQHWISSAMKQEPSRRQNMVPRREILKFGVGAAAALAGAGALGVGLDWAIEQNVLRNLNDFQRYIYDRKKRMQLNNLASLSVGKREALIDAEVSSVGNFLRSTEGKRILESGTTEEIWKMLIMMPPL